jgi:hypothetical protein
MKNHNPALNWAKKHIATVGKWSRWALANKMPKPAKRKRQQAFTVLRGDRRFAVVADSMDNAEIKLGEIN